MTERERERERERGGRRKEAPFVLVALPADSPTPPIHLASL